MSFNDDEPLRLNFVPERRVQVIGASFHGGQPKKGVDQVCIVIISTKSYLTFTLTFFN